MLDLIYGSYVMNFWIFIVTSHKLDDRTLSGSEIFRQRMEDKFWGLGEGTPNRRLLELGDRVVFYIGNPQKVFAGTVTLAGPSFQLSTDESEELSHGEDFYRSRCGVRLDGLDIWAQPRPVDQFVQKLKFIENKKSWGTYFQGGIRRISEEDFRLIDGGAGTSTPTLNVDALESASEFALEAHLEDFIDKNWDNIDFGQRLTRYQTEEQDGRQFPAGAWSIDFLCTDKDSGEFVIVELKRGKSSDAVVGQTLRYMTWVQENLATAGQKTHGIIIAGEADDALHYAVRSTPSISLRLYKIDFKLLAIKK